MEAAAAANGGASGGLAGGSAAQSASWSPYNPLLETVPVGPVPYASPGELTVLPQSMLLRTLPYRCKTVLV